jgi:undecaprenyl-diphosphatase
MPLGVLVALAALLGAAEALPISASGHNVAAGLLWDGAEGVARAVRGPVMAASVVALFFLARRRIALAASEGVRAVARPTLFREVPEARDALVLAFGCGATLVVAAWMTPLVEAWSSTPMASGLGLLVAGASLGSLALAPTPSRDRPPILGAVLVGAAAGIAAFPGASRVGAGFALLSWFGVRPRRAVDFALLIAAPALAIEASHQTWHFGVGVEIGSVVLAMVIAFCACVLAGLALRSVAERRRVSWLALWIVPLGLATMAYARALPNLSL